MASLLFQIPFLPVLPALKEQDALALGHILNKAGLSVFAVQWKQGQGLLTATTLKKHLPACMVGIIGALSGEAVKKIAAADLAFAATPGLTLGMVASVRQSGLPLLPGVSTVSDILQAREEGFRVQMLFPAKPSGGIPFLRHLAQQIEDVSFCIWGDLAENELTEWLALPNVLTLAGDWMIPRPALETQDWPLIEELSRRSLAHLQGKSLF